jgi:hypothetical protein
MADEQDTPDPEEFEKMVEAALKVDPKGISGKHRKRLTSDDPDNSEQEPTD